MGRLRGIQHDGNRDEDSQAPYLQISRQDVPRGAFLAAEVTSDRSDPKGLGETLRVRGSTYLLNSHCHAFQPHGALLVGPQV